MPVSNYAIMILMMIGCNDDDCNNSDDNDEDYDG